jgi:hypothetical protein
MKMSVQHHDLTTLLPVPIEQEAGWATELIWMQWQREKIQSLLLLGIEP